MNALVFLAPGFEEIEAITIIDVLRRAEIETTVAGLVTNPITASRKTRHLADIHIADLDPNAEFDIIVLPGGAEGAKNLAAHHLVQALLLKQFKKEKWIAAICAGPTALPSLLLETKPSLIAHPSVHPQFSADQVQTQSRFVVTGKLITGLSAGAAMEFSYEIVRHLLGQTAVDAIDKGVIALQK